MGYQLLHTFKWSSMWIALFDRPSSRPEFTSSTSVDWRAVRWGCTKFPKLLGATSKCKAPGAWQDAKAYWCPSDPRSPRTKFCRPGDVAHATCASLLYSTRCQMFQSRASSMRQFRASHTSCLIFVIILCFVTLNLLPASIDLWVSAFLRYWNRSICAHCLDRWYILFIVWRFD